MNDKPYRYESHYFPHDIQVRELTTGTTRLEVVQRLFNNKCHVLPMTKIMDGINNARVNFHRVWFDEDKTQVLRNSLANYSQEWDEKK
jgi:phage terminase large subunit